MSEYARRFTLWLKWQPTTRIGDQSDQNILAM